VHPSHGGNKEVNPWKNSILDVCRGIIRFSLWFAVVLNGVMLAIFSIVFTYEFLCHLWTWCDRVLFPGSW